MVWGFARINGERSKLKKCVAKSPEKMVMLGMYMTMLDQSEDSIYRPGGPEKNLIHPFLYFSSGLEFMML